MINQNEKMQDFVCLVMDQVILALPWREVDTSKAFVFANKEIRVFEDDERTEDSSGGDTTGRILWDASVVLSSYLERVQAIKHLHVVLELGCGHGLVSMACAALGAKKVVASDAQEAALKLCQRNIELNHLESVVTTRVIDWTKPNFTAEDDFHVVVASDTIYSQDHVDAFIPCVKAAHAKLNFVCMRLRSKPLVAHFEQRMTESGFTWRVVLQSDSHVIYFLTASDVEAEAAAADLSSQYLTDSL